MNHNKQSTGLKATMHRHFNRTTSKHFYSFEITPKSNLVLNMDVFEKLPLFVALTWIENDNLRFDSLKDCPVIKHLSLIKSTFVLAHITCCSLSDTTLDEFLESEVENLAVFRGGT